MIEIRNVQIPNDTRRDVFIPSTRPQTIEASRYTLLPALIDPHVHFRTPGHEHKETWETGVLAAIAGGVTHVLDMPNNYPSCCSLERVLQKKQLIESQLQMADIPLRYGLYLGADRNCFDEIAVSKNEVVALKIYMGSSTGDLLLHDRPSLEKAFQLAAEHQILVAVHAEDEGLIQINRNQYSAVENPQMHSVIRNPNVAAKAVEMAIECAQKFNARLYLVHISSAAELSLIRQAKRDRLSVYAEASPHHLFLSDLAYGHLHTKALVNPPLRARTDVEALWESLQDGTIDTIGTDHAPHTKAEKMQPFGLAPSGFASIELYLALLLNAHHQNKISLKSIIALTHTNVRRIFNLPSNDDCVLVDLEKTKTVTDCSLKTKAKWSPYAGWTLTGWPCFTILKGRVYAV